MVDLLHRRILDTLVSEKHPNYLVVLVNENENDAKILTAPFNVGNHQVSFTKVTPTIFVSDAQSSEQLVGVGIERALGHGRFVLTQILTGRYYGRWSDPEKLI